MTISTYNTVINRDTEVLILQNFKIIHVTFNHFRMIYLHRFLHLHIYVKSVTKGFQHVLLHVGWYLWRLYNSWSFAQIPLQQPNTANISFPSSHLIFTLYSKYTQQQNYAQTWPWNLTFCFWLIIKVKTSSPHCIACLNLLRARGVKIGISWAAQKYFWHETNSNFRLFCKK